MARPRKFSEEEVVAKAALHFAINGYNATTIDELVLVTGLQRGSLYKAFGSKLNLFTICITKYVASQNWAESPLGIDLMIVCLREVVHQDRIVERHCKKAIAEISAAKAAKLMGSRLVSKLEGK